MTRKTQTEQRYAICIGVDTYSASSGLSALQFAEADAIAVDALLESIGFPADHRRLLVGAAATLEAINQALDDLLIERPGPNDLIVLFFAGHGVPVNISDAETDDERAEIFLAPYDYDRTRLTSKVFLQKHALSMGRLRREFFESAGSRKRLFIFDSCYSGDFAGPRYRDDTNPVHGYIHHMLNTTATGRVSLASCLPTQRAIEDARLGHGRLTFHLLKALTGEAKPAQRSNGAVTIGSLFDYLSDVLPESQRPVLSGTQHESFELVRFNVDIDQLPTPSTPTAHPNDRVMKLTARLHRDTSFLQSRLDSFVGRQSEIAEIRNRITSTLHTGGYVTITGDAGQGKSSIIARLVYDELAKHTPEIGQVAASVDKLITAAGVESVAFHFIPLDPGADHQVGLLHNLIARLCLKHGLPELYVAPDSRAALRDYLVAVLRELERLGCQEVIYIDGLDQILEDSDGQRDLSFLPTHPPAGIVFVVGTRPNDTLKPLELRKPNVEYRLPGLSRSDFDLILLHRNTILAPQMADSFYNQMEKNALFLDLVARELHEAEHESSEKIIARIAENPLNLFGLAVDRLKRNALQWRTVLKPILGLLLVARTPLSGRALRALIGADDDELREGLRRLGGLLTITGERRYTLYHLMLRDFLREDVTRQGKEYVFAVDEMESYHQRLVDWCTNGRGGLYIVWDLNHTDSLEQERRAYAREYYIAHLAAARNYAQLWDVIDTGEYGRAKLRFDPSTRAYALDLDLARQAVAEIEGSFDERLEHLPRLWRYSLLRCTLSSRADAYSDEFYRFFRHSREHA